MSAPAGTPAGPRDGGHGDWPALAVGWALSALDSPDEARFAVHLPDCDECAGTVRRSLHTVADLAYALPDEEPPPALKVRIMAAVRAEPRRRPNADAPDPDAAPDQGEWPLDAGIDRPPAGGTDQPVEPWTGDGPEGADLEPVNGHRRYAVAVGGGGDRPESGTVVPFGLPARSRWAPLAAVAAVILLLVALGGWNVRLRSEQGDLRQVVAQRSAEVAQRDALIAQRDAAIRQLTANGPARIAALTADGQPSAARRATIVVRGNQIEIITEGLGASPENTTYWLWTLRCDTPQPSDLKPVRGFTVPQAQFSVRSIGSDPGFADASCFAISQELGTATPTTPREVVAVGQPE